MPLAAWTRLAAPWLYAVLLASGAAQAQTGSAGPTLLERNSGQQGGKGFSFLFRVQFIPARSQDWATRQRVWAY